MGFFETYFHLCPKRQKLLLLRSAAAPGRIGIHITVTGRWGHQQSNQQEEVGGDALLDPGKWGQVQGMICSHSGNATERLKDFTKLAVNLPASQHDPIAQYSQSCLFILQMLGGGST